MAGSPEQGRTGCSPVTGRKYCYQLNTFFVISGTRMAFLDHFDYDLSIPSRELDGEVFISLRDCRKIFGTDLCETLPHGPELPDGGPMIPFTGLSAAFGGRLERDGDIVALGNGEGPLITVQTRRLVNWRKQKKRYGELFRTRWQENAGRLNTYRLYVPSGYGKEKPDRMIVVLHGASGDSDSMFRSCPDLEYYAERHNYVLLAVNSLVQRGNFGSLLSPQGMFPIDPGKAAEGDCGVYKDAEKMENKTAEQGIFEIIDDVKREYGIDENKVFLMGNSMGGIGSFHLPCARPGFFRAVSPAGAIPELDYIPYGKLGSTPFLLVFGTEDHNWFERAMDSAQILKERGMNLRFLPVGGYNHSEAWARVIEDIFEFFDGQD